MGIACSSERTCWVACECQSDWSTSAPSGEYVYATDTRYAGGLSSMSANGSLSSMSANGNLSTMSGNYSISTMGSNGGMTCYKKACPNGGYLDEPNSTYFMSSQKGGTLGLTCYNATSCASGYSENGAGASYSYHSDITCKKCTYSCPSGYSFTTKSSDCSSSQTFKTTSATTQSGCTPNNECGKCETSYSGGGSCVDKPCQKLCCLTGSNKYLTTINGMTCCCPSASETDDKKCNCCL